MKWKRISISLWLLMLLAVFIVTLINHSPYFLLGGSSSVAPIMEELLAKYPNNHKNGDFNYVSSASSGAPTRVESGLFGIGWLSENYQPTNPNILRFQLLRDGLIIVYNIPESSLTIPGTKLNFTPETVQQLYLENKSWNEVFPGQIKDQIKVKTFTRPNGSGTRNVFDHQVLGGTTFYQANTVDSSSAMLTLDVGSIGYSSFADFNQSQGTARVKAGTWGEDRIEANFDTIKDGSYKLWRPFTGLINYSYKYQKEIINLLKWIYLDGGSEVDEIFAKFGPQTDINKLINWPLRNWLQIN